MITGKKIRQCEKQKESKNYHQTPKENIHLATDEEAKV